MKRFLCILLCLLMLLPCALPVLAADGVPKEVMEATKSVVRILSEYKRDAATGSGFVIKNDGTEILIATNNHVVDDNPKRISVWVGQNRQVDAEIVFTTSAKDLCVLRLTEYVDMAPLTLSREDAQHGAAIYVVGYPGAGDVLSDTQAHTSDSVTITDGIISAIRTFTIEKGAAPVKLLQVNAAINSGNSGGPLFNTKGEVIGVNTYKVNVDSQGVFGSVDIGELWSLLDEHGITIAEEEKSAGVADLLPMEEPEKAPAFLLPIAISAAAVVLLLVLMSGRRKKKAKAAARKPQTTALTDYMAACPNGMGIGGAVSMLLPVAIQLRNFHNDGRLHLQVCPENIRIGAEGALLKEPTGQESGRFNNGFASPEIYRGAGFGITSDVYSFAALLLYAATGKVPANSLQPEALEQDLALLDNADFAGILRRAMASGTADRIQSMQELIYGIAVYNIVVREKYPLQDTAASASSEPAVPAKTGKARRTRSRKKTMPKKWRKAALGIVLTAALMLGGAVCLYVCGFVPAPLLRGAASVEVTNGMPLGNSVEAEWFAEGDVTVYSYTQQLLDNGFVRYTLEYATAEDRNISIFDPPNGEAFKYIPYWRTKGGRQTLVFDIPAEKIAAVEEMTIKFFRVFEEAKEETYVYIEPYHFDLSILPKEEGENGTILPEEERCYQEAETLLANGETAKAAIAFGKLGDYKDAREISFAIWKKVPNRKTISFGVWDRGPQNVVMFHALRQNGTIAVDCRDSEMLTDEEIAQYKPSTYENIVSVHGAVGLRYDGTLSLPGSDFPYYQELVAWSDLVAISVPYNPYEEFFVGLKSDGTVVAAGSNQYGECNVTEWKDIIAITTGEDCTYGLKSDGTVVAAGRNLHGMCEVESWTDIKAISTHDVQTFGLKQDGTVVAIGSNYNGAITRASKLTDIAFIEGIYAFKEDGTSDSFSKEKWNNIVSITYSYEKGGMDIVGLRKDGAFVFSRGNDSSYLRARAWTDIQLPTISEEPITMPADDASAYAAAETLLANGETAKAAIAFGKLGDYQDARQRSFACWRKVIPPQTISVDWRTSAGLKSDGTVVLAGVADNRERKALEWSDIVSIDRGRTHIVGLKADGTVVAAGLPENGKCDVSDWTDIVAVRANYDATIGLKSDGTAIMTSADGTKICDSKWDDIVAISDRRTFLRSNGLLVASGISGSHGKDIIAISATGNSAVLEDGTVIGSTGDAEQDKIVSEWCNIIAVEDGPGYIVGLKADGTVELAGCDAYESHFWDASREADVSDWTDIVAIAAGMHHILGLKSDGTVLVTGKNEGKGEFGAAQWTDIKLPVPQNPNRNNPTAPSADPQSQYAAAETLLAQGETAKAAIAFGKLGDYKDARQRSFELWSGRTISVGGFYAIAVKQDGTVAATGQDWDNRLPECRAWDDIVSIDSKDLFTVGLKCDGTVVANCADISDYADVHDAVSAWKDIVAVRTGGPYKTVGLKADGTIVTTASGEIRDVLSQWTNIVEIDVSVTTEVSSPDTLGVIGLRDDGTVAVYRTDEKYRAEWEKVRKWTDIVSVHTVGYHVMGIKSDGTVMIAGWNTEYLDAVSKWTDIVDIDGGRVEQGVYIIGLKSDGTTVTVGNGGDIRKTLEWENIVEVEATDTTSMSNVKPVIGLQADGTVVVIGIQEPRLQSFDFSGFQNIRVPQF